MKASPGIEVKMISGAGTVPSRGLSLDKPVHDAGRRALGSTRGSVKMDPVRAVRPCGRVTAWQRGDGGRSRAHLDVRTRAEASSSYKQQRSSGWVLSERDYPQGEVILGIEIRSHSVKAAPVDTANAEFQRPGVSVPLEDISAEALQVALEKIAKHFSWKGPVGISYTRLVVRALGGTQPGEAFMANCVPEWRGKVATMIHTEAAAYAEMYFGPGRENSGNVLVCTLGKGFGAVLYNRGQKVRNADFKHITWTYERELKKLQKKWGWSGVVPPFPASENFLSEVEECGLTGKSWWLDELAPSEDPCAQTEAVLAWAALVDRYLQKVAANVSPELLILLPTGRASDLREDVLLTLFKPGIELAGLDAKILSMGDFPDRALVKGAAVGAHIELQSKAASGVLRDAICRTVTKSSELRAFTDVELDWVFKKLDSNKDGEICESDLATSSRFFGANLSVAEVNGVIKELQCRQLGSVSRERLGEWWASELDHAVVSQIQTALELKEILSASKGESLNVNVVNGELRHFRDEQIVVVQAGFSYCRPCKKFEGVYESIARNYPGVSFYKVVGDSTPASAHLCKDVLEVASTPDFRIFKGGELVAQFTGANKTKLEDALNGVLSESTASV